MLSQVKKSPPPPVKKASVSLEVENIKEIKNPYIQIISKRLRTLKKRLTKIEKYEQDLESNQVVLNEDQILAVKKKEEVVGLIKEMEEICKQMFEVDLEEQKILKKTKKQEQLEKQKSIQAAIKQVQDDYETQLKNAVQLLLISDNVLSKIPESVLSIQQKEKLAAFLSKARPNVSVEDFLQNPAELKDLLDSQYHSVQNFSSGSDESFSDLSYKEALSLVQNVFDFLTTPIVEPQFIVAEETVEEPVAESEQQPEPVAAPAKTINFFTSTMIEEEAYQDPAIISFQVVDNEPKPVEAVESKESPNDSQNNKNKNYRPRRFNNERPRGRGGFRREGTRGRGTFRGKSQPQQQQQGRVVEAK